MCHILICCFFFVCFFRCAKSFIALFDLLSSSLVFTRATSTLAQTTRRWRMTAMVKLDFMACLGKLSLLREVGRAALNFSPSLWHHWEFCLLHQFCRSEGIPRSIQLGGWGSWGCCWERHDEVPLKHLIQTKVLTHFRWINVFRRCLSASVFQTGAMDHRTFRDLLCLWPAHCDTNFFRM